MDELNSKVGNLTDDRDELSEKIAAHVREIGRQIEDCKEKQRILKLRKEYAVIVPDELEKELRETEEEYNRLLDLLYKTDI